jgi:antitoxin MazE
MYIIYKSEMEAAGVPGLVVGYWLLGTRNLGLAGHKPQELTEMRTSAKKWGNSGALGVPAKPMADETYKLDDLLKGITEDNIHEEIDFGRPEGKEAW